MRQLVTLLIDDSHSEYHVEVFKNNESSGEGFAYSLDTAIDKALRDAKIIKDED